MTIPEQNQSQNIKLVSEKNETPDSLKKNVPINIFAPPYQFYTLQQKYIDLVQEAVKTSSVLLVEAGTGFGKTIANLFGILESLRNTRIPAQLIYLSKTHNQNQQVIEELQVLNEKNPQIPISGIQMASRRQLCHIQHVRDALPQTAADLCQKFRENRRKAKEYYNCISLIRMAQERKTKVAIPIILTSEQLLKLRDEWGGCAYLTARDLISEQDVVAGHYYYFLDNNIRNSVGLDVEENDSVLVLDEAHNLENVFCELYSRTLNNTMLERATIEVEKVDYRLFNSFKTLEEKISQIIKLYGKQSEEQAITSKTFEDIWTNSGITKQLITDMNTILFDCRETLLKAIELQTGTMPSITACDRVLDFFTAIYNTDMNSNDFGYILQTYQKGFRLTRECLNPAIGFQQVRKQAKSVVICSGTLSPLPLWAEILGCKQTETITQNFGSVIDPRKVRVIVFKSDNTDHQLSTKYEYRQSNPEVYTYYNSALLELIEKAAHAGILIFFPSYDFLDKVALPHLYMTSTGEKVRIYSEVQDARENKFILDDFKQDVALKNKVVLVGVLGGKLAEGADFPDDLARMVIVCGIPYPPPNDPYIKLKREFYDTKRNDLGKAWYQAQAYRIVAQALGRGWRSDQDWALGVLLDYRYAWHTVQSQLPLWIKNRIKIAQSWNDGIDIMEDFLKKMQLPSSE